LLFAVLVELLGLAYASSLFMEVWLFVFCLYGIEVGTKVPIAHEGNVSEKLMMGMQWVQKYHWSMRDLFYPSSIGTLTCIKLLEMICECACATVPE
jgi:hypothetical protein